MKTLVLNTELLGLSNLNTYSGLLQSEYVLHESEIESDYNEGYISFTPEQYFENFSHSKYMEALTKKLDSNLSQLIVENINEVLKTKIIKSLKFNSFHCPKEYNFNTDIFICDVILYNKAIKIIKDFIYYNEGTFTVWLKENYSSYDGFISFVETDIDRFIEEITSFDNVHIGVFFQYILEQLQSDELKNFLDYGVFEMELYYSDFVDFSE